MPPNIVRQKQVIAFHLYALICWRDNAIKILLMVQMPFQQKTAKFQLNLNHYPHSEKLIGEDVYTIKRSACGVPGMIKHMKSQSENWDGIFKPDCQ